MLKEILKKYIFNDLTANNFNSFQRKPINTLSYATMPHYKDVYHA